MLKGLLTTLKAMFVEKPVTIQYPEQKRPVRERFKGRHSLEALKWAGKMHWLCTLCGSLPGGCNFCGSGGKYR